MPNTDSCSDSNGPSPADCGTHTAGTVLNNLLEVAWAYPDVESTLPEIGDTRLQDDTAERAHRELGRLWKASFSTMKTIADTALEVRSPCAELGFSAIRKVVEEVRRLLKESRAFHRYQAGMVRFNMYTSDHDRREMSWTARFHMNEARRIHHLIDCLKRPRFPLPCLAARTDARRLDNFRDTHGRPAPTVDAPPAAEARGPQTQTILPPSERCPDVRAGSMDAVSIETLRTFSQAREVLALASSNWRTLMNSAWSVSAIALAHRSHQGMPGLTSPDHFANIWLRGFDVLRRLAEVALFDIGDPFEATSMSLLTEAAGYVCDLAAEYRAFVIDLAAEVRAISTQGEGRLGAACQFDGGALCERVDRLISGLNEDIAYAKRGEFFRLVPWEQRW